MIKKVNPGLELLAVSNIGNVSPDIDTCIVKLDKTEEYI